MHLKTSFKANGIAFKGSDTFYKAKESDKQMRKQFDTKQTKNQIRGFKALQK